ncbi:Na+/H+ antiporter NhaA [Agromyces seonyuensis]|uniref:Na(+)/H(+) antiporter NhaA n=1 Tax=Agromyces seonyuensis TaxID=2662446 RepID=A0A6I4P5C5_9MICO|nr:Na+/H+ antiporter NhaA [Agromyces seonyuensis]MWB99619.1 sodium:proton antiporter [Agromyces seonyuensis]
MRLLRSDRFAAALLLGAAVIGLALANSPVGPEFLAWLGHHIDLPWLGLDLSAGHWISDGLLAIFFFIAAVDLRRELTIGELNSLSKAALPGIAAAGGVIVPIIVYLIIDGGANPTGWPIPTATDIAFALGVLALFGRFIPVRVRVFLLALAVLDDIVGILLIAFFFTDHVELGWLGLATAALLVFAGVSRLLRPRSNWVLSRKPRWPIAVLLWVLAIIVWYGVLRSGVHATIAGVLLGLVITRTLGGRAEHQLTPWSNGVVLPLFAFTAAAVAIPQVAVSELSPAFWAILVALPVGKFIGITLAAGIGGLALRGGSKVAHSLPDLMVVASLGGIGFTVSLLMNDLAFGNSPEVADEGTLAVLGGSLVSIIIGSIAVSLRSRHYGRVLRHGIHDRSGEPNGAAPASTAPAVAEPAAAETTPTASDGSAKPPRP